MERPAIVTAGSTFKDWLQCQRKRWLGHEVLSDPASGRRGWERVRLSIPLSTGGWCHRVAQGLLLLASGGDLRRWTEEMGFDPDDMPSDASKVILNARTGYLAEVGERGLDGEGTPLNETQVAQEQAALLEAFGWAFERVRVPALLSEYEIVSIEREEFTLLAGDVGLAGRCDAVLRRRSDGLLFVWNLKTVSQPDARWKAGFEVDQQLMLEALAVERRLGERVYGCLIEGFIKGPRVEADDDLKEVRQGSGKEATQRIQRSRLLYGYKLDANPPIQKADYDWEGTTRKGWHKFRVWEEAFEGQGGYSPLRYWINWLPQEVIEGQFEILEPIIRSDRAVESKLAQVVAAERNIRAFRSSMEANPSYNAEQLDAYFPQNEDRCHRLGPCPFLQMCWNEQNARDPLGSGLYQPRTPNHPEGED